ncbi:hypothetical protein [Nocardia sp. alder85J]|uniref:hypothetical protein n=1 Tax=Nocardia sp. alder85J TaxID=2862949 RepID=UPI001CD5EAF2|nr:hypothetical protein [Nocardia sp. alder85J]MCX4098570.1 hypothetical protein [Nocardia sp. alder85J]
MTRITLEIDVPSDETADAIAPILPYLKEIAEVARRAGCTTGLTIDGESVEAAVADLT